MQGRQTTVQPGIAEQSWESIHALEQRRIAGNPGSVLRGPLHAHLPQSGLQRLGWQFGGAATTGHRRFRCHGTGVQESSDELVVDPTFPSPQQC